MTGKSRYLASINQQQQQQHQFDHQDPSLSNSYSGSIDDPPPPPPNPPSKRNIQPQLQPVKRLSSAATSRTSAMSSSRNSSSEDPARENGISNSNDNSNSVLSDLPASMISVGTGSDIDYDEILNDEYSNSHQSSHFSLPALSTSSGESTSSRKEPSPSLSLSKQQKLQPSKKQTSKSSKLRNSSTKSSSGVSRKSSYSNRHDIASIVSSDSYSTLGFSQMDSVLSAPPPPPPPGGPGPASQSNKASSSSKSVKSSSSSVSSSSLASATASYSSGKLSKGSSKMKKNQNKNRSSTQHRRGSVNGNGNSNRVHDILEEEEEDTDEDDHRRSSQYDDRENEDDELGSLVSDYGKSTSGRSKRSHTSSVSSASASTRSTNRRKSSRSSSNSNRKKSNGSSRYNQHASPESVTEENDDEYDSRGVEQHEEDYTEEEDESVITEVLRYGEVDDTPSFTTGMSSSIEKSIVSRSTKSTTTKSTAEGNMTAGSGMESIASASVSTNSVSVSESKQSLSVAEKRRRKAQAAADMETNSAHSNSVRSANSRSTTQMGNNSVFSASKSKSGAGGKSVAEEKSSLTKPKPESSNTNSRPTAAVEHEDPPLVLYDSSEDETTEDDMEEAATLKKKGKKRGGFFKVKKLIGLGAKSPNRDKKDSISGRMSPVRRGLSPGRWRGGGNNDSASQKKISKKSPFRVRGNSSQPSIQSGATEEKRSSEIVVDKKKVQQAEAQKEANTARMPFDRFESDLSFETSRKPLNKLESDLSLASSRKSEAVVEKKSQTTPKSKTAEAESVKSSKSNRSRGASAAAKSEPSTSKSRSSRVAAEARKIEARLGQEKPKRTTKKQDHDEETKSTHRSRVDPPIDSRSSVEVSSNNSDEVSEMTNPTFMSNKMDPPEESNRGLRKRATSSYSSGGLIDSDTDTPLMSNQVESINVRAKQEKKKDAKEKVEDKKEDKSKNQDEFFGGSDWNVNQTEPVNDLFTTINPFKEKTTASKDPFDEPFFSTPSKDADHKYSFALSESDGEFERPGLTSKDMEMMSYETDGDDPDIVPHMAPDQDRKGVAHNEQPRKERRNTQSIHQERKSRSKSPNKKEVMQRKRERNSRTLSPSKAQVLRRTSKNDGFLGIDETSGFVTVNTNKSSYLQSPGVKLEQSDSIEMNEDGYVMDTEPEEVLPQKTKSTQRERVMPQKNKSAYLDILGSTLDHGNKVAGAARSTKIDGDKRPELTSKPSFLARRKQRDQKEIDIRAKLDHVQYEEKADKDRQEAALRAKKRMDTVTRASERGRRKSLVLENQHSQSVSPTKRYSSDRVGLALHGRHFSPPRSAKNNDTPSPPMTRDRSASPRRSVSPRRQSVAGVAKPQGQVRGKNQSRFRERSPMRVVESTRGGGPSMRVSVSKSTSTDSENDSLTYSVNTRKTFKAPAAFQNNRSSKRFEAPDAFKNPGLLPAESLEIVDPIQRAGMRLLSAAAIPIQTEMRRVLGKRRAEDRAWAIITAQAYFRRWKAELMMYKYLYCATRIQAAFRGWLVRDALKDKHYCATQIQRICRGYLATMKVYEALYNITVVQSVARRHAAIKEAETRYDSIICIQSVYRGVQCRRSLQVLHNHATVIQTAWRSFSAQMNYQFDVVDIIIVQSVARRRSAQKKLAAMKHRKYTKAAVTIQKYWRSYDSTMNYLHSIADILIVQSVVRRWIAARYVPKYRDELHRKMSTRIQTAVRGWVSRRKFLKQMSAIKIQKTFRGFHCYIDYVFTVADIVMVQTTVRGWLAKREFERVKEIRSEERIQNAAITIQKTFRGYQAHMNMLFTLVHIIIVQSVVRRRIAMIKLKPMLMEHRASTSIQRAWRNHYARTTYFLHSSARIIQAAVRGWFAHSAWTTYKAARKIQSWYRCQATRRGYVYYTSARKIQSIWRGHDARKLAEEERWVREYAATMIQKTWKMCHQHSKYTIFLYEKRAATTIQSMWRGFWEYSHFVILRYEVIRIQAAVRGYQTRQRLALEDEKALVIQTAARVMLAKKYCHMERLFSAMLYSAQMSLTYKNAAAKIQTNFHSLHYSTKEKKAALVIERFFIWVRSEVEREIVRRDRIKLLKRKKLRSRGIVNEDSMLDSLWDNTIETSNHRSVKITNEKNFSSPRYQKGHGRLAENVRSISPTHKQTSPSRRKFFNKSSNTMKDHSYRSHGNHHNDSSYLAVDVDDALSDVSGLTTPTITSPRFLKLRSKKGLNNTNNSLDDELDAAWEDTKQRVMEKRAVTATTSNRKLSYNDNKHYETNSQNSSSKENSISPPRTRKDFSMSPAEKSPTRSHSNLRAEMYRVSKMSPTR